MKKPEDSQISALSIALQFGYTIAIPLIILALLGRFLDKQFDTSPWLLIAGIILSMVVSSVALVMKFTKIMAQITQEDQKKKEMPPSPGNSDKTK